jgi:hypothetical protein
MRSTSVLLAITHTLADCRGHGAGLSCCTPDGWVCAIWYGEGLIEQIEQEQDEQEQDEQEQDEQEQDEQEQDEQEQDEQEQDEQEQDEQEQDEQDDPLYATADSSQRACEERCVNNRRRRHGSMCLALRSCVSIVPPHSA